MIRSIPLHRRLGLRPATRRFAAAVALAVTLSSSAGLFLAPVARAWDVNTFSSGSESQLITLQNQARASGGLKALKLDTALRTIARWRSKDMAQRDYFSHTIPGSGTDHNVFWYMQHKYDYCFKVAGENIGQATWPGASEEDVTAYVFGLFMDSSGHRANIMGKSWDVVAVGAYRTTGDHYVWTALFADKCAAATPAPTPKPTAKPTPKPTAKPTPEAHPQADGEANAEAHPQADGEAKAEAHPQADGEAKAEAHPAADPEAREGAASGVPGPVADNEPNPESDASPHAAAQALSVRESGGRRADRCPGRSRRLERREPPGRRPAGDRRPRCTGDRGLHPRRGHGPVLRGVRGRLGPPPSLAGSHAHPGPSSP